MWHLHVNETISIRMDMRRLEKEAQGPLKIAIGHYIYLIVNQSGCEPLTLKDRLWKGVIRHRSLRNDLWCEGSQLSNKPIRPFSFQDGVEIIICKMKQFNSRNYLLLTTSCTIYITCICTGLPSAVCSQKQQDDFIWSKVMYRLGVMSNACSQLSVGLKCLWQNFFHLFVRFYIRFWCEKWKKFSRNDFPSPRFSHLKAWNLTSGWVKNRVKTDTGDSWVVTCHQEHIDNQMKEKWEIEGTCQQPENPSLFLCQSS